MTTKTAKPPAQLTEKAQAYNASRIHAHNTLRRLGWWPFVSQPGSAAEVAEIVAFQTQNKLTADGAAGPAVFAALRRLHAAARGWRLELPHGIQAIEQAYGPPGKGKTVKVPIFPGTGRAVGFHVSVANELATLLEIAADMSGYTPADIQTINVRKKRGGDNPGDDWSVHSYAAAFDADPSRNPWGNKPSSPLIRFPAFLEVFRALGWRCGADWKTPDTMHVQACTGY